MRVIASGEGFRLDEIAEISVVHGAEMGAQSEGGVFGDISLFLGSKTRSSGGLTLLGAHSLERRLSRHKRKEDDETHSNISSSETRCFEIRFSCDSPS